VAPWKPPSGLSRPDPSSFGCVNLPFRAGNAGPLRQREFRARPPSSPTAIAVAIICRTARLESITAPTHTYTVRGRTIRGDNCTVSLSGSEVPKIAPPRYASWGDRLSFLLRENLPGYYPYAAGVYPYRRTSEEPVRMFAGEGTPERTNRRFHYLARGHQALPGNVTS
jgi:hypothetical protein